jgi:hypothetical protein
MLDSSRKAGPEGPSASSKCSPDRLALDMGPISERAAISLSVFAHAKAVLKLLPPSVRSISRPGSFLVSVSGGIGTSQKDSLRFLDRMDH